MLIEIAIGSGCFIIGFLIGNANLESGIRAKLRKRGYTIIHKDGGYYGESGYKWTYNGYDNNVKQITIQGPLMPSFADVVANADAHFHAKIMKEPV